MENSIQEGGCYCGTFRFRSTGKPVWVTYCHCKDCRKITGAPVTVFVGFENTKLKLLGEDPKVYQSSDGVSRSFCVHCGTPLFYKDEQLPEKTYFLYRNL